MRILSNFPELERLQQASKQFAHTLVESDDSFSAALKLFLQGFQHDVILLNQSAGKLLAVCLFRWLWPLGHCRLVSVDLVLPRPTTLSGHISCWLKKVLLRRVNLFVHYFKDLEGYERYYGISPDRSKYIPFKVNNYHRISELRQSAQAGSYVLFVGRSHRDPHTFLQAMSRVPYPAILLCQDSKVLQEHGTSPVGWAVPHNVKVVQDDGTAESWLNYLAGAKLVVIAVHPRTISAAGIGTYLEAMALGKCTIITECPATRGLLRDEAIIVPPEDPEILADSIRKAWEHEPFRKTYEEKGRAYATQCGDEHRLLQDLIQLCQEVAPGR